METSLAPGFFSPQTSTRPLDTAFQISPNQFAVVQYSVQITVTASIAGGQEGDVFLETADDAGFTQGVKTLGIQGTSQTYSLAVALQGVQKQTTPLMGCVEPGKWCRLRTSKPLGNPTFSFRSGLEILFS